MLDEEPEVHDASRGDGSSLHDASEPAADAGCLQLAEIEARLLGAMIEKALATPQNYPMSLNALATACNQTTNRDPITDYSEDEIAALLPDLKARGLLRFVHPTSGRGVTKYRHVLDEALGVDDDVLALLSVMLVRGPQTPGELRTRTERLADFADVGDIEALLPTITDADANPLVVRLEREPGRREARWAQLLCPAQGVDRAGAPDVSPRAARASGEVAELREALDDLRRNHEALRAEFDAFRAEFG